MSATLPPPGSIWRNRQTALQMRVIFRAESDIVAHDAEQSDFYREINSWRGDARRFEEDFDPGDPENYPKTAA